MITAIQIIFMIGAIVFLLLIALFLIVGLIPMTFAYMSACRTIKLHRWNKSIDTIHDIHYGTDELGQKEMDRFRLTIGEDTVGVYNIMRAKRGQSDFKIKVIPKNAIRRRNPVDSDGVRLIYKSEKGKTFNIKNERGNLYSGYFVDKLSKLTSPIEKMENL